MKCRFVLSSSGIIHMSKIQPETVENNSSTVGHPAGIELTPLRCRCNALTTEVADKSKRDDCVFQGGNAYE